MRTDVWVFPGELCSTQGLEVLEPGGETGEHSRAGLELLDPSLPPGTASIINVPTAFHRWLLGRQRQGSGTRDASGSHWFLKHELSVPPWPGFLR